MQLERAVQVRIVDLPTSSKASGNVPQENEGMGCRDLRTKFLGQIDGPAVEEQNHCGVLFRLLLLVNSLDFAFTDVAVDDLQRIRCLT